MRTISKQTFNSPLSNDKVVNTNMDLTLSIESGDNDRCCQHAGYLPCPQSLLSSSLICSPPRGYGFQTVSCVPPLRLGGTMPEREAHAATGCSARLIDDANRQGMTPGDRTARRGNLCRFQRWPGCAIHPAPRRSCRRVITASASPERRTAERAAAGFGEQEPQTPACVEQRAKGNSASNGAGGRQLGIGWRVGDAMRVAHCQRHASPCADIPALRSLSAELRRTSVLITAGQDRLQRHGEAEGGENMCSLLSLSLSLSLSLALSLSASCSRCM